MTNAAPHLTDAEVENHVCCVKRRLCTDDHFHRRDVERIIAARIVQVEALIDAACHHCGSAPDEDGDHSCPCPRSDNDCTEHAVRPVMPDGLRAALTKAAP